MADLLQYTKILAEFVSSTVIGGIIPTSNDEAWALSLNTITLLNRKGEVKKKIEYNEDISDIHISPTTNNVWGCSYYDSRVIGYTPSGSLIHKFDTDDKPTCLCVTRDEHILVGTSKEIIKYTTDGEVVPRTHPAESEQPIFHSLRRITECGVTQNIAVADWDETFDGGQGKKYVMILDGNLDELFRYYGDIPKCYQQSIKKKCPFYPREIQYDSAGNLVISDWDNRCLNLVSGVGQYMKLLHVDQASPCTMGIDHHSVIWVVSEEGRHVKVLQYYDV